ncbi:serine hydrolase [Hutsoniella sourekii]
MSSFLPVSQVSAQDIQVASPAALVIDWENGQILYEKESQQVFEVGGISKLLLLYLIYDQVAQGEINLDDQVHISDEAYNLSQNYDVSNVPLRQDEEYSVEELAEAVIIAQANGASLALAEHLAGSEAACLDLMSEQLNQWEIKQYELASLTGLTDQSANRMNAEAVATIAYHLLQVRPEILTASGKVLEVFKPETEDAFDMRNANLMLEGNLYGYPGTKGLMPVDNIEDSNHLIIVNERDGLGVISVVLGAPDQEDNYPEYIDTKKLLDHVFSTYKAESIINASDPVTQVGKVSIVGGKQTSVPLIYQEDLNLVVELIDTAPRLIYTFQADPKLATAEGAVKAPLKEGQVVGSVEVNTDNPKKITYLPSAKGNKAKVAVTTTVEKTHPIVQSWRQFLETVGSLWQGIRKFFISIFN